MTTPDDAQSPAPDGPGMQPGTGSSAAPRPDQGTQTPSTQFPPSQQPVAPAPVAPKGKSSRRTIQFGGPDPEPNWFHRGFGIGAGAALGIGVVTLAMSLIASTLMGLLFTALGAALSKVGMDSSSDLSTATETVWGPEDAKDTLRAIDVRGAIMAGGDSGMGLTQATYGYEIADTIDKIGKDDAGGLVLRMDTPGGTINGARAIGEAVERYQKRTGHKVVAVVEGMSASGGMFAMAPADRIIADHGTLTGSIGVISGPFERYKDVKAVDGGLLGGGVTTTGGIESEYISQGKGKDFGNPYRDMTAEERKVWSDGIAREYDAFVDWVSTHRKIPAATIRNDLGAHIFDPETAKEKKLVDDVMGRDEAYRAAAKLNGLDPASTKLVASAMPGFWQSMLASEARIPGLAPAATTQEGQKPVVTSTICSGSPQVLAWNGPTAQFCGR